MSNRDEVIKAISQAFWDSGLVSTCNCDELASAALSAISSQGYAVVPMAPYSGADTMEYAAVVDRDIAGNKVIKEIVNEVERLQAGWEADESPFLQDRGYDLGRLEGVDEILKILRGMSNGN